MVDYAENKPLSEIFNINPEDYTDVSIETLSFSVRVHNRLNEKHIKSVKDLLMVDVDFLKNIKGFGVNCINQVFSYCERLAQSRGYEKTEQSILKYDFFVSNRDAIAMGDFSFAESSNLSEDGKLQLTNIKEAFNIFGADLIYECVHSPEKIIG